MSHRKKRTVEDNFRNLIPGDMLWYRNNRLKEAERWLEATFVKRISINVFQMSVNGHVTSAHRDQLRLAYSKATPRCALLKHNRKRKRSED